MQSLAGTQYNNSKSEYNWAYKVTLGKHICVSFKNNTKIICYNQIRRCSVPILVSFQGEAERGVLNALALMRDMQDSVEEGEEQKSPHSPSKPLTAILENSEGRKAAATTQQVRNHDQAQPQPETPKKKGLGQKGKARSLSTVSPPFGIRSGLKFPSTSALSSIKPSSSPSMPGGGSSASTQTSQGRYRSASVTSKHSAPRRPSTTHGGSRSEKKHSVPSRT